MNHATKILFVLALGISASAAHAEDASQYNMSLQDKVITGPKCPSGDFVSRTNRLAVVPA